jgi:hypothetical protein
LVVIELGEAVGIEAPLHDRHGELADVVALLLRLAGAPERRLVKRRDALGRDLACEPLETQIRGTTRRKRDLLLEDDLDKGGKALRPVPERRRPEPFDDRGEMRVAFPKLRDALGERLDRKRVPHGHRTSRRRFA